MPRDVPTPLDTSSQVGDLYETTRTLRTTLQTSIQPQIIDTLADLPTSPGVGDSVYVRATSSLLTWDGYAWRLPWNLPWGRVADVKITTPINNVPAGFVGQPTLAASFVAVQGRRYAVSVSIPIDKSLTSLCAVLVGAPDGSTIGQWYGTVVDVSSATMVVPANEWVAATSGPATFSVVTYTGGGTYTIAAAPSRPAWIHVDDIGPGTTQAAPTPAQAPPPPVTGVLGVVVTTPAAGVTLAPGVPVTISALASAATGKSITKVEFFIDGALLGSDTSTPYSVSWTPASGPHSITAKVTQSDAAVVTSAPVALSVSATTGGGGGGGGGGGTIPPKLHVSGLVLNNPASAKVTLRGWNQYVVPAFVDSSGQMAPLTNWFDTHLDTVAADWQAKGVNCVRIPVMKDTNTAYINRVVAAVNTLGQRGMYVILTPFDAASFGGWPTSGTGGTPSPGTPAVFGRSLISTADYAGNSWNSTDGTTYNFTVATPTNGRTVFAYVTTEQSGGSAVTPTVSGLGLTWTQRGTTTVTSTNTMRVTLFTGVSLPNSPPSGTTFTVTAGSTQMGCGVQLSEFSNVDPTTPVSFVTTGTGTAVGGSINLSTAPTSGMVYAGFSRMLQENVASIGTGWSPLSADSGTAPVETHMTQYNTANAANASATFTTSAPWVGIAAQVNGTGSPGTGTTGTTNDVAIQTANFMLTLWTACGKPSHLMLEVWNEPVGTALTQGQWQSGVQAAIGVLRTPGTTMYDGPIIITTRNWGWTFDSTEATAIRTSDSNVVFSSHRFAVSSPTSGPLATTDPTGTWKPTIVDAAANAGCALLMGAYGIYNGGYGVGGSQTANAQGWGAAMSSEIQAEVTAGHCVGGLGWMWTWGAMDIGEDSENAGVNPTWPSIVSGTPWTLNVWGQVVQGMITALAGTITPPAAGAPTVSLAVVATAITGASVTLTATATAGTGSIISVDFFVDGVSIAHDTVGPYTTTWTAVVGQHALTALVTQSDAQTATSTTQIIVSAPGGTAPLNGFQLERAGSAFIDVNGNPTVLRGVAQYVVEYVASGSGAGTLYTWFSSHIAAVALDWKQKGANLCRIPIYNTLGSTYINDLKAKVDALWAQGIYSMICAFDSASFGAVSSNGAPDAMMAIWTAIGAPRYCFIETSNEPNGLTAAQWQTAMDNWRSRLRAAGYRGIIFMGARDWSWTADLTNFQSIVTNDVAVGGSKPGNICFINHTYAVTDPANAVQPANYGTATWKVQWPDVIGAAGLAFVTNEWGPWNGGTAAQFGIGGSYNGNVDGWGENMRQEIQNAVQAGHSGGATGWMWAWSDPNGMTGPDAPTSTAYVEGTTAPPWTLNRWGQKMWSLVATLAGTPTLPGQPTVTHSAPSTAQTGNIVTITAAPVAGGTTVSIAKVDLLIDSVITATDTVAPYSFTYTAATGTHTIQVIATQSDGKTASSSSTSIVVSTGTPPSGGAGLLHVSGKLIKDASNNTCFLRGLNQYIVTPYFNNGTDYLFSWFDGNIGRVADDWYSKGVRHVRMPINVADTSTAYYDFVKRTVQTIMGKGIYVSLNGFGGLGSYPSNAGNVGTYLVNLWIYCGRPAMLMINLWNEPNEGGSLSNAAWLTATQTARSNIRSGGYTGIIFFDANIWATVLDTSSFATLLSNDSAFSGNLAFSTHRYHALCGSGYLPTNWMSSTNAGGWIAGGITFCAVVGEFGWFNCYGDFPGGGQAFCNDAVDTIIAGKNAGNLAGAWAWMWTWDENSLVDPSQYNITQGAVWSYNGWGQIAERMWANTAQGI